MSETGGAGGSPALPLGWPARLIAAAACSLLLLEAALDTPRRSGLSGFGLPRELAVLWVTAALGFCWLLLRTHTRLTGARSTALLLLLSTLFAGRATAGADSSRVLLAAVTLWLAAPWLTAPWQAWRHSRWLPAGAVAVALLLCSLPAVFGSVLPAASLRWLVHVLPVLVVVVVVPPLFAAQAASVASRAVLLTTAFFAAVALGGYLLLADGLSLPIASVLGTRLRPAGLHPNLAVPWLLTGLMLGLGLAVRRGATRRWLDLTAVMVLGVALLAVDSRTGLLATGLALLLFLVLASGPRLSALLRRGAAVAVVAALLLPATGLTEGTIARPPDTMVSKAVSFRAAMWELGRDTLAAAPWQGFGPGTGFQQARYARPGRHDGLPKDDHPHNVVLAVGTALGWTGLAGLALLFAACVRQRRPAPAESAASAPTRAMTAAMLAIWAANAIDLGGAEQILFPAPILLLLALREAHGRSLDAQAAPAARAARGQRAIVGLVALALAGFGAHTSIAAHLNESARAQLEALAALDARGVTHEQRLDEAARTDTALQRAARWSPADPDPWLQTARAASLRRDLPGVVAALEQARARFPGSAALAHQLALVLSQVDVGDPRVDALLAEALAADRWGPQTARMLRDRAQLQALNGRIDESADALAAAISLDPGVATSLPSTGTGAELRLFPGPGRSGVTLGDLLARLEAQRARLDPEDFERDLMLRLRTVDLLIGFEAADLAEAACERLLADVPHYLGTRRTQIAALRGEAPTSVEATVEVAGAESFWLLVDASERLAADELLDQAAFEARVAQALVVLGRGSNDVLFDKPAVIRLLAARRLVAERQGDLRAALRWADALAFASR